MRVCSSPPPVHENSVVSFFFLGNFAPQGTHSHAQYKFAPPMDLEAVPCAVQTAMQDLTRWYTRSCQLAGFILAEDGDDVTNDAGSISPKELAEPAEKLLQRYWHTVASTSSTPPTCKTPTPPTCKTPMCSASMAMDKERMRRISPVDVSPLTFRQ